MLKKSMSCILIIMLVLLSGASVFALGDSVKVSNDIVENKMISDISEIQELTNGDYISEEEEETIISEINVMEEMGLSGFNLTDINVSEDNISYVLNHNNINTIVSVNKMLNGSVELYFVENDKEDILLKTADGRLFLDGQEIIINFSSEDDLIGVNSGVTMPRAGFTYSTTTECPYGSPSQYSYYAGSKNVADLTLPKAIAEMTKTAIVSIMKNALFSGTNLLALGAAVLTDVAESMIEYAINYDPNEDILSFKSNTYYHNSTHSYTINNTLKVKKVITEWYIGQNYAVADSSTVHFVYGIWG